MKAAGTVAAVALVGMIASGGAMADGNELLDGCQQAVRIMDDPNAKNVDHLGVGQCFGMLEGVRTTLMVVNEALPPKSRLCFPDGGISNGQSVRIVTKYLRDHPAQLHQPGTFLVISAYQQAFPCKK